MTEAVPSPKSRLPGVGVEDLLHIPGETTVRQDAQSLRHILDPLDYCRRQDRLYGPVSRGNLLSEPSVNLLAAETNELIFTDRQGLFSSYGGWHPLIGDLFPRGLMLRDFGDHREQRRLMQPAFKSEALAGYLEQMRPRIAASIARWVDKGAFALYPEIKKLALEIAAEVFLGLEQLDEIDQVNRDFVDLVEVSTAINRVRLLGGVYARGLEARARLEHFFGARVAARRDGNGSDLFSRLCRVVDDEGQPMPDDVIVDHMIFLMMAAHDTTTSAMTTMAYALARHPEWQERLRADASALGRAAPDYDDLDKLETTDWMLKEALRLYPPLTTVLRRTTRDCEILGYRVPAHTALNIFPVYTHRLPQWWNEPDQFDPLRFSPARAEHKRHAYAWVPFGAGAHTCIGLHFATMQVKAVITPLLLRARLAVPEGYAMPFQFAPISRPRDGLPVSLTAL